MKKFILIAITLAAIVSCTQKEDEWTDLFNGENLDGWVIYGGDSANFFVEEGVMVAETKLGGNNVFLATPRDYANFELLVDFKATLGMNSGVQVRGGVHKDSATFPYVPGSLEVYDRTFVPGIAYGYQIEIDPSDRKWTGGFYEEGGRGWIVPLTESEEAREAFKLDEWNTFRIIADGNHFQIYVNDIMTVDTYDDLRNTGWIGLQLHRIRREEQVGLRTSFKNIKIKELE